jgi:hypothetical protein
MYRPRFRLGVRGICSNFVSANYKISYVSLGLETYIRLDIIKFRSYTLLIDKNME